MTERGNHASGKPVENWSLEDERRMEVIMRNGPTGEHYLQQDRQGCGQCSTCQCGEPKP